MILLENTDFTPKEKIVCALGLFDGVHLGHRLIISKAVELAEKTGGKSAVFSFKTNTVTSKGHDGRLEMLISDRQKQDKMEKIGVDYIYSPDFESLRSLSPEEFVRDVLVKKMNCAVAVCGTDFTFGRFAKGKASDLEKIGEKYGMKTVVVSPLLYEGEVISSTRIRKCVREGKISLANKLLGEPFAFELPVEYGLQLGRTWGFPTINQEIPAHRVMPQFGVYCSKVYIDKKSYVGVTNIGVKPTVENTAGNPLAETFIVDFQGDVYGKTVKTELYEFVRKEKKFRDFEELKEEIGRNTTQVINYFRGNCNE